MRSLTSSADSARKRALSRISKNKTRSQRKDFGRFVPVVREAIEYLMQVFALDGAKKIDIGDRLLKIYANSNHVATPP